MTEETKQEQEQENTNDVTAEFQRLGRNVQQVVQVAIEKEEFRKFRSDLQQGLADLGTALNNLMGELSQTSVGQKVKTSIDDLQPQAKVSEVENKVRQEMLNALRRANSEVEKTTGRWRSGDTPAEKETEAEQPGATEEPPSESSV